jgi:hypothetical protein
VGTNITTKQGTDVAEGLQDSPRSRCLQLYPEFRAEEMDIICERDCEGCEGCEVPVKETCLTIQRTSPGVADPRGSVSGNFSFFLRWDWRP